MYYNQGDKALILSRFNENLPPRPNCTDDFDNGVFQAPKEKAINKRYIQPNYGVHHYIVLDIDHDNAFWGDYDLPVPTIRTITRATGRSHWLYELKTPVYLWVNARPKPMRWLLDLEKTLTIQAEADEGYKGNLTKKPLHPFWQVETYGNLYPLAELEEHVRKDTREQVQIRRKQENKSEYSALGRNCHLFDHGRFYAYPIVHTYKELESFYDSILQEILHENSVSFTNNPLGTRECEGIAKSISEWTFKRKDTIGKGRNKVKDKGDLRRRQSNSAHATNQKRKDKNRAKIYKAVAELKAEGKKITGTAIIRKSGLSRKGGVRPSSHLEKVKVFPTVSPSDISGFGVLDPD